MLSQTAEYALRVVVFLASREDNPATIAQIAAATQVPQGYLAKVLQSLARAGLTKSQRGLHGGQSFITRLVPVVLISGLYVPIRSGKFRWRNAEAVFIEASNIK